MGRLDLRPVACLALSGARLVGYSKKTSAGGSAHVNGRNRASLRGSIGGAHRRDEDRPGHIARDPGRQIEEISSRSIPEASCPALAPVFWLRPGSVLPANRVLPSLPASFPVRQKTFKPSPATRRESHRPFGMSKEPSSRRPRYRRCADPFRAHPKSPFRGDPQARQD
jgi:hypothetical protein